MKASSLRQKRKSPAGASAEPHGKQSLRLWIKMLMTTTIIEKKVRLFLKDNCNTTLPRFDVMAALYREDGKISMSRLSEKLLVSNGNVTGVISRLIEDGLVVRETDPNDRRIQYVALSERGRSTFLKTAAMHEQLIDSIFGEIADSEISEIISIMDDVHDRSASRLEIL